ncbi:MAG: hypothetical protein M1836_000560 [Candelina mexicana]|nr:MAG: hypothetical protein M1836_000560 [Candelina mexicana]
MATALSFCAQQASAKAVFAHFIIGNSANMATADWTDDIQKAKDAHIDGFALNIAPTDTYTDSSLRAAYDAANALGGFSLFLSFDYLSQGVWDPSAVIRTINTYKNEASQYKYNNKPFVSTFEGVQNTGDWANIKSLTGCYFVPSWTSLGSSTVASNPDVDGAFAWDAWPVGANDKDDSNDKEWKSALGAKSYMMAVSPWFYTNIPNWGKNWLWRGDDLWYDRWQQVIEVQPEFVEIITWNDYGETHYIGPIRAGGVPDGSQHYVSGMDHDHWRTLLPFYIDAYKSGNATMPTIDAEKLVFWYRLNPSGAGSNGGTTGNNPAQGQPVVDPAQASQDKIFVSVLVKSPADVTVQIGSNAPTSLKATTAGVNHFSVPFNGQTGSSVSFAVSRNGQQVVSAKGNGITNNCGDNGLVNWNAWVGGSS